MKYCKYSDQYQTIRSPFLVSHAIIFTGKVDIENQGFWKGKTIA
jgi:hypothetical protein